jgi:predicted RNA-binding Zn-ribbon protein involved in translation (DUF1610 family)
MFFKKKSKKEVKCDSCNNYINENYSFCPHCGVSYIDPIEEAREFGMLGKSDENSDVNQLAPTSEGITDKIIGSVMQSIIKNMVSQIGNSQKKSNIPEIQSFPNGIKIKIGLPTPIKKVQKKIVKQAQTLTEEQIEKMSKLPRATAKTNVRRLPDKVLYEISASGILSPEDIFISKTESGYEVKAIGKSKIYTNNLPINLPLKGYSISEKSLLFEFSLN